MNAISFVKPNYEGEKRVSLMPEDILSVADNIYYERVIIETGFGEHLGITDSEYENLGCIIADRSSCFKSKCIFSLKLIQPIDYDSLQAGSFLIGWMHPNGSGKEFCKTVAREKLITIFDIDSAFPRIYRPDGIVIKVTDLPPHFLWENSYIAGKASTILGLKNLEKSLDSVRKVCVLGTGNVSQGAFQYLSELGLKPRMFSRKTLDIFYSKINEYDIIVNGIEMDIDDAHILSEEHLRLTDANVMIIDAAADAGRAIQGTEYRSISSPVGIVSGRRYTLVNNSPTLLHREASKAISSVIAKYILTKKYC